MKIPTIKEIIIAYIKYRIKGKKKCLISSSDIQSDLPKFAVAKYQKYHTPETYIRQWRIMKQGNPYYKIFKHKPNFKTKMNYYEVCRDTKS